MDREMVIVIDFGGQYNQLVARRVRECNVYCEIYSYKTDIEKIKAMNPKGIILTGGPNSCYEPGAPSCTDELFNLGIPVLGLCYGAQLMMHVLGGKVEKAPVREYGKTEVMVETSSPLFTDVTPNTICWMSHFDYISKVAPGFDICAHTADCPVAAAENRDKNLYAIQFHPEVLHTQEGTKMLSNFVRGVCGCSGDWKMDAFVENTIKEIRAKVGNGKVLLALSGGVDSSVAAGLPFEKLTHYVADKEMTMFRLIPNTAISEMESMTLIASRNATKEQEQLMLDIFNQMGLAMLIPEEKIAATTAMTSCGIAYVLKYIQAAMQAGVEMGIYPKDGMRMVAQSVKGAAELILNNDTHPSVEIDKVCTPGGITIKGINELEHEGFTSTVIKAIKASK